MITLTLHAQQRLLVLTTLDRGELLMAEAAELLGLSTRQVRRLRRGYRQRGPAALVHGNRGHRSPRRVDDATRARIVRLARTTYAGVNHRHLTELLAQREGVTLSHPTIHRLLKEAGLRSPRRRRPPKHRRRRERMPQEGLLVQLDGSKHAWLDRRGPLLTLIATMDDATGEVPAATFRDEEDTHGYLLIFHTLACEKGVPVAMYSDRHGIFHRGKTKRPLTLQEQLAGTPASTQVARALQELGIQWIPANSPQAKGRIERLFGTFQDRLRTELRLAGVVDRQGANAFLRDFLPRYNARFAQPAANPTSAYRPWPTGLDPQTVFCFKYQRTVSNDNTVSLGGQQIQLLPGPHRRSYAKAVVEIHERLDGTLAAFYQGVRVPARRLTPAPKTGRVPAHQKPLVRLNPAHPLGVRLQEGRTRANSSQPTRPESNGKVGRATNENRHAKPTGWKPAPDHPWRHMPIGTAKRRPSARKDRITEIQSGQNY